MAKVLFFFLILVLTIALYLPGLSGPFLFDDYPNLETLKNSGQVDNWNAAKAFVFSNESGPTGRPVSMATFLLDGNSWPTDSWPFKFTNLLIHLLVGIFGFLAIRKFLSLVGENSESRLFWLPGISLALWLVHPLNVSTVLYVVQRMAMLSALFSLVSLFLYLKAKSLPFKNLKASFFLYVLAALFFVVGVFSKENAALLLVFIVFIEIFVFRDFLGGVEKGRFLAMFAGISIISLLVLYFSYQYWGGGYLQRDFSIWQRMYYQFSALGDYALKTLIPVVSQLNLFNGTYENASEIVITSAIFLRFLLVITLIYLLFFSVKKKWRIESFGLFWFFCFHLIESTILPLELYFEHRNYFPGYGLIVFVIAFSYRILDYLKVSIGARIVTFFSMFLFLASSTFAMAATWSSPGTLFLKWEMDEPLSARAKVVYANYLDGLGFPENAVEHLDRAIAIRSEALGLHLNRLELICRAGIEGNLLSLFESAKEAKVFDFGVTNQVERLIGLADDQGRLECKSGLQPFTVEDLFEISENARAREWNSKRAARFFSLKSDYYASLGNLDSAVTAVEVAASYQPTVDLFLKASVMLASAGLYDDALEMLFKAREADEQRRMFYPSRIDELNSLEYAIKSLM